MSISLWNIGVGLLIVGLVQKFGFLHVAAGLLVFSVVASAIKSLLVARQINTLKRRMATGYGMHTH